MLSFEERENGKIRYSINSKDFAYPGKYGCTAQNTRSYPDTSVSLITLKEKGKENGERTPYTGGKENFSNNVTLSSNLPISEK